MPKCTVVQESHAHCWWGSLEGRNANDGNVNGFPTVRPIEQQFKKVRADPVEGAGEVAVVPLEAAEDEFLTAVENMDDNVAVLATVDNAVNRAADDVNGIARLRTPS